MYEDNMEVMTMKGATDFDKLCHRIFDADRTGKDYLARRTNVFCENCGYRVYAYYCEDQLFLTECECCEKKVLVKAKSPNEAASKAFWGVYDND